MPDEKAANKSDNTPQEQSQTPYEFKTSEEVQFLKEVVDRSLPPNTRHLTTLQYKNLTVFVISTDSKMVMVDDGFLPLGVVILNVGKPKGLLLTREEYEVPYEFSSPNVYEKYGVSDMYRMSELNGLRLLGVGKPYRGPMLTGHGDANSTVHSIEGVPVSELINYLVSMVTKRYGLVLRKILATSCNSKVGDLGEVSIPVFYALEDVRPFSFLDRRTSQRGRGTVDYFVTWGDKWMAKYPGKEPVVYRPKAEDIAAHPPLTKEEIKFLIQKDVEDRERAKVEEAVKTEEDESPKLDRSRIVADYMELVKASFASLGQRIIRKSQTESPEYTTYDVPGSVNDRDWVESTIYGIDSDVEGAIAAFYQGELSEEEFNSYMMEKANELKEKWSPAIASAKSNIKARQDAIKILDSLLAGMPETHTIRPFRSLLEEWRRELKII